MHDDQHEDAPAGEESYNPWTVVNLVFRHLADEGLHPVLGEHGDPGQAAAELLRALGVTSAYVGRRHAVAGAEDELARLRERFEAEHPGRVAGRAGGQAERP